MVTSQPNPASYFTKRSVLAIAAGSVVVAIVAIFLLSPQNDLSSSEGVQIPDSIADNIDSPETQLGQQSISQPPIQTGENPVIAEVNGQEIHLQELRDAKATIQAQTGQGIESSALLDQLITKEILLQEAENRGISVTRQEAESSLEQQITQNGMAVDQFKQRLQAQGTTFDNTVDLYHDQITIDELLSDEISSSGLSVSPSEAESFFDVNIDAIKNQFGDEVVFEDVSELIENTILQQKQKDVTTKFFGQLRSASEIITYEDRM